jgi:hypothetical protein
MKMDPVALELWSLRWPNFPPHEIACRGTGVLIVQAEFMDRLQALRNSLAEPMHVTSGCRSASYNASPSVRGKASSFHICDEDPGKRGQIGCLAVDVAAPDGAYRGDLFEAAWCLGWSVGWNAVKKFLHLDQRALVAWRQTSFDY